MKPKQAKDTAEPLEHQEPNKTRSCHIYLLSLLISSCDRKYGRKRNQEKLLYFMSYKFFLDRVRKIPKVDIGGTRKDPANIVRGRIMVNILTGAWGAVTPRWMWLFSGERRCWEGTHTHTHTSTHAHTHARMHTHTHIWPIPTILITSCPLTAARNLWPPTLPTFSLYLYNPIKNFYFPN